MGKIEAYKFVEHKVGLPKTFQDPKGFLREKYSNPHCFGIIELMRTGQYREMGYIYNFQHLLKRFVYKQNHYGWQEAYAPNKTLLRTATVGRILEIVELT